MKKIAIAATTLALFASTITIAPATAAPVAAANAVVLAKCSVVGQTAVGRGADGSDLKCMKATKGGMKGKNVWQYATLPVIKNLDMIIPNTLTSGFGGFGKAVADAMKAEGLSPQEPILTAKPGPYNLSLQYMIKDMAGKAGKIGVTGFAQVGGAYTVKSAYRVSDATPIARMMGEYNAIAVKADSEYKTIEQLVAALKKDPKSMAMVGGTVGGIDTYTAAQLFEALNIDISNLNYTANNGQVPASILSDAKYAFGVSGYADFAPYVKAGTLKVLAIAAPTKIAGISAPTFKSKKINVVVENWRGLILPPNTSATAQKLVIRALDIVIHSKSFNAYLTSQNAFSLFMPGAKFKTWLKTEEAKIRSLYTALGL